LLNAKLVWKSEGCSAGEQAHDFRLTVIQGDAVAFVVSKNLVSKANEPQAQPQRTYWDPVITYVEGVPEVWQPNAPSSANLALNRYARSKYLVSAYRPFDAVDGDLNTGFTVHADDRISSGDDWLQVDLEKSCRIDRYILCSQSANSDYRPTLFGLQCSDDGFVWKTVDAVAEHPAQLDHYYGIPTIKIVRDVAEFQARYIRLYLPKGKPFTISELGFYYTAGQTSFGPPIPAGE
jgi:hypothetical protein